MKVSQCKLCAKPFKRASSKAEFCCDRCKWRYWADHHPRVGGKYNDLTPCIYCGLPATSIDHIPPQAERKRLVALNLIHRYQILEVDACRECNSALGARPLWTISERKKHVKEYLTRKYSRLLKIPHWPDDELADLGRTVASSVLASIIQSQVIKARIAW